MKLAVLEPNDHRWLEILATVRHDFYHLPEYVTLEAGRLRGVPGAILVEEGDCFCFVPLVFRKVGILGEKVGEYEQVNDAISPYGYPCFLTRLPEQNMKDFVRSALLEIKEKMSDRGLVSIFVRTHPLFAIPEQNVFNDFGLLVNHGNTVWIDLTLEESELWKQTRQTCRNLISRLKKKGFAVTMDQAWQHLPEFESIYNQTMDTVQAEGSYYFGIDYFRKLKEALGEKLHLCVVRNEENKRVAAGLFSECSNIVQYHLSGSLPGAENKDAVKLMLDFVRRWAKERGNSKLHLGGGVGCGTDSLFFFKTGFSKLLSEFHTWRMIVNDQLFDDCVSAWEQNYKMKAGSIDEFFPPYRKELAVTSK